ncbi:MAG: hypothetical protein J6T26_04250 [Firmicutes bacterium]|nr:hypothetical protein [Bacillota bacterium]
MNPISVVLFFSCLFVGIVMGYYCGSPMYFDLKYAVPLTERNEERHKVRKEWAGGKLISRIKRAAYIRAAIIAAMAILVTWFCTWGGNLMTGIAGLLCYLAGVAVFVLSQTSGSVHDQEVLIKYRNKYRDYLA